MASRDLPINAAITVPGWSLTEIFKLTGGPGGQNVNKVETGVQLRFAYLAVDIFDERQLMRLEKLAGSKVTKEGEILIDATQFRSQERNRDDGRERLKKLILAALAPPPPKRRPTRPSRGAVERRLKSKSIRGDVKKARGRPEDD